ncbi:MAG: hypothetical protein P8J89_10950, partial [Phycisphaerales bacterium]|nr:hypothetical protein [Phycisphaerales bacterium]
MRRRKPHGGVSLFAFQDILFGTIGIILMMMILFILMIGAEISIDSPQSASTQEENRSGTDVLEDRVERLQAEKTYLEDLLNADYTRRS